MWSVVLLTVALSVDGLLVGLSYGMRGIRIPLRSLCIVAGCTLIGIGMSMGLGRLMSDLIQPSVARSLGGVLLMGLGLWQLMQGVAEHWRQEQCKQGNGSKMLARFRLRSLGIVVQILNEPTCADRDSSGSIESGEAVVLGVALGLDTLAAGLAASLMGIGLLLVVLVPLGLVALIELGLLVGRTQPASLSGVRGFLVPAALLIVVGFLQMF